MKKTKRARSRWFKAHQWFHKSSRSRGEIAVEGLSRRISGKDVKLERLYLGSRE